jgi:hypothetical protein
VRNLVPLEASPLEEYLTIARGKEEPRRSRLLRLSSRVKRCFLAYTQNSGDLAMLPRSALRNGDSAFLTRDQEFLRHCYKTTVARDALLERIRKLQPSRMRWICQYCCGVGHSSTWDHYLGQAQFPEFSVFTPNLIPACAECNTLKGEQWISYGKRVCVNFYYDHFDPNQRLIEARINIGDDGDPEATFFMTRRRASRNHFGRLFARHWRMLDLERRLREAAESKMDAIGVDIRTWAAAGRSSVEDLREEMAFKADELAQTYGANYVDTVLYRAAAASRELIEYYLGEAR